MKDGTKMYTLVLKQKESRGGYRKLSISGFQKIILFRKLRALHLPGKKVEIALTDIKTNVDLPNGIFKFDIPATARVIKNPMISEE